MHIIKFSDFGRSVVIKMKSRISVSTWSLQQLTYTENATVFDMIDLVKEMGGDAIDICEEYIPCHPQPDLVKIGEIREKVVAAGLQMGTVWFCTEVQRAVAASSLDTVVEIYQKNIQIAKALGAAFVCIPALYDQKKSPEENRALYRRFLERILPYAEKYDMPLTHECARKGLNGMILGLVKEFGSKYYSICPDLEAWRFDTADLPLMPHAEDPGAGIMEPEPIELFRECVEYAPYIHFKLLKMENGEEPHFPIPEIMDAINGSSIDHLLCLEYEGWIPDIVPERNALEETKKCLEMMRRYQRKD